MSLLLIALNVAAAGSAEDAYEDLVVELSAPDEVEAGETFELAIDGELVGGSDFSVFSFGLYRDADWSYDASHMVTVDSGEALDVSGFEWGYLFEAVYELEADEDAHTYTFVLGYRDGAHDWYDLAVDLEVGPVSACVLSADGLSAALDALDDSALLPPTGGRRQVLEIQIAAVAGLIDAGEYERALLGVNGGLRRHIVGLFGPSWILDGDGRAALNAELDALSACLAAELSGE